MSEVAPQGAIRRLLAFAERERRVVLEELAKIRGLMPLLMKRRNRGDWSKEDVAELRLQLKRLRSLSPYIAALVLPGGFALLPLMAWWLDRRRTPREKGGQPARLVTTTEIRVDQAAGKVDAPP